LHSPDETKFCPDRQRPANTFPPVFAGQIILIKNKMPLGLHPMAKKSCTDYSQDMKIQNEENIIPTNYKCRALLLLALPLTFAAGCASNPANSYFTDKPTPIIASASKQQMANQAVAHEIYAVYLTNRNFAYTMVAAVNNEGTVTLQGPIPYSDEQNPDRVERQRIDSGILELASVNQVKDELDVATVPIRSEKTVASR
jgi:hypothetical protein